MVATALKQVIRRVSRLAGGHALLVFNAIVVCFGISSLQAYGERIGHERSPVSLVARLFMVVSPFMIGALHLARSPKIAVYIARRGWLAMFRRAFPGRDSTGATMKGTLMLALLTLVLQACSSPLKPPEPTGQWVPVNQPMVQQSGHTEPK